VREPIVIQPVRGDHIHGASQGRSGSRRGTPRRNRTLFLAPYYFFYISQTLAVVPAVFYFLSTSLLPKRLKWQSQGQQNKNQYNIHPEFQRAVERQLKKLILLLTHWIQDLQELILRSETA